MISFGNNLTKVFGCSESLEPLKHLLYFMPFGYNLIYTRKLKFQNLIGYKNLVHYRKMSIVCKSFERVTKTKNWLAIRQV